MTKVEKAEKSETARNSGAMDTAREGSISRGLVLTVIVLVPVRNALYLYLCWHRLSILILLDLAWWWGTGIDRNAVDDVCSSLSEVVELGTWRKSRVISGRSHTGVQFQVWWVDFSLRILGDLKLELRYLS